MTSKEKGVCEESALPSLSSLKPILHNHYPETEWEKWTLKSFFFSLPPLYKLLRPHINLD